jgi:ribosome maturation factor RimP
MSIGEKVSLLLKDKTKIKAKLINVEDSKIFLQKDGEESSLDYGEIAKAKTYFEW